MQVSLREVVTAAIHRTRPILLTASAAILGMIPIAPTVFWGPMAFAIIGGLAGATALTLIFLPALYVAWFRVKARCVPRIHPRGSLVLDLIDQDDRVVRDDAGQREADDARRGRPSLGVRRLRLRAGVGLFNVSGGRGSGPKIERDIDFDLFSGQ